MQSRLFFAKFAAVSWIHYMGIGSVEPSGPESLHAHWIHSLIWDAARDMIEAGL